MMGNATYKAQQCQARRFNEVTTTSERLGGTD